VLNDLWEFNPSTSQWAWMGGSSTAGSNDGRPGVYGTLGTPAAGNVPGGRSGASSWTDSSGNLWLFAGGGNDANNNLGYLNDLWEFSPSTNQWAWMGGSNVLSCRDDCGQSGVYGTLETPAAGNIPGGRDSASSWTDSSGNLWLFGGWGYDASASLGTLNDLWMYQPPATLTPATTPVFSLAPGTYPTAQTVTISDATPGATIYYSTLSANGYLPATLPATIQYKGPITVSSTETLYAIAKANGYSPSAEAIATYTIPLPAAPNFKVAPGTYSTAQTVTISDATPGATIYYTTNGTTPTTSSTKYTGPITVSSTETLMAIATVGGNVSSTVAAAAYTITFACHINYTIYSQWLGGFEAGITIDNTGTTAIGNWTLTWTFANGQKITQLWDGNETQSGAKVTVTNMSYNGSIPAGGSYTGMGFNGSWNNTTNAAPTSFAVNGTTCK
jgi:hypothetical protein